MRSEPEKNPIAPTPPTLAVLEFITDLEYDMGALRDGTKAMAIVSEVLRDTQKPDYSDLEAAGRWTAHQLEQMAHLLHEKWELANSLAFDAAYPEIAARRVAKGKDQ